MARAALAWSREELAERSGTSSETIKNFEIRGSNPTIGTVNKWRRALKAAGVIFLEETDTEGEGVRLKK
jgi:transcriptional regulator with XRE-family HTH domain